MRATLIYGAGDVRVEDVPDPQLKESTDALVRVLRSCVRGSDLWPHASRRHTERGDRIGHEFLGVVDEVCSDVPGLKAGDVVVAPFVWAHNTCDFCREGLHTSCRHGGFWGVRDVDGGQGDAVSDRPRPRLRGDGRRGGTRRGRRRQGPRAHWRRRHARRARVRRA